MYPGGDKIPAGVRGTGLYIFSFFLLFIFAICLKTENLNTKYDILFLILNSFEIRFLEGQMNESRELVTGFLRRRFLCGRGEPAVCCSL